MESKALARYSLPTEGLEARLLVSRKSCFPDGINGEHLIVSIFHKSDVPDADGNENSSIKATDVHPEDQDFAILFAMREARTRSAKSKAPGVARVTVNLPGAARRDDWHAHITISDETVKGLGAKGFEIVQCVSPDIFIVPKKK